MNEQQRFTVTLEQLNQMADTINTLGQQIGAIATAPLVTQLNALISQPVEAPKRDKRRRSAKKARPNGESTRSRT